jgi:hypothetical protein
MRTQNQAVRHEMLQQTIVKAAVEAALERPLPTKAWMVRDNVNVLVDTRSHRKIRNGRTMQLHGQVIE